MWVFHEYPVAVVECCCQDIVGERQRCAVCDRKVQILLSPKTETANQKRKITSFYKCGTVVFFSCHRKDVRCFRRKSTQRNIILVSDLKHSEQQNFVFLVNIW